MIIVPFELWSAQSGVKSELGLILIDNQGQATAGTTIYADYRVRAYRKGTTVAEAVAGKKPLREAMVHSHPKDSKSVWNLMFKALKALGYDK